MAKLENVCRLCLRSEPSYYLFDESLSLIVKIEAFCSFKIEGNDRLPKYICSECTKTIDTIIAFKNQCENSYVFLRSQSEGLVSIEQDDSITIDSVPLLKCEPISEDVGSILNVKVEPNLTIDKKDITIMNNSSDVSIKNQNQFIEPSMPCTFPELKTQKNKEYVKAKMCPFCSETYTKTNPFEEHLRTHKESPFECDICKKKFNSRKYLICHMVNHRKSKQCEMCGAILKNLYGLQRHVKYVHKTVAPVPCKICNAIFYRTDNLRAHMRNHKGAKAFECDICKQKFTLKSTKICHMRTHTGEKPYNCKYCDAKFSRSNTLLNHVKLHTGEMTHHCLVCVKGFIRLSDYKIHLRKKHKELDVESVFSEQKVKV